MFVAALPLLAALVLSSDARASDSVDAAFLYYVDTDNVSVASPHLAGTVQVGPVIANAATTVDIISAASVDIVTAASPRGFHEERYEGSLGASYELREGRSISAHIGLSSEPDYLAYSAGAGVAWDVFDRAATISAGYSISRAEVGRTDDTDFFRSKIQHEVSAGFSPIFSPKIVADFSYGLAFVDGYQANPYRYVLLYARGATSHATAVLERLPSERFRHTASARLRFRFAQPAFGLVEQSLYFDTWGIWAASLRTRATLKFGAWTASLDGRFYRQTSAAFYRRRYSLEASVPVLRAADKELGAMWTARLGPHVDWTTRLFRGLTLRLGLGGDVYHMRYLDFAYLDARTGLLASADAAFEF